MDSLEAREMTVNVTPLHDRVLIRRLEEKETAKGGIIIPDAAKEKPQEGEVIAVGAGKIEKGHRVPLDVKGGDRILFGKLHRQRHQHRRPGVFDPPRGGDPGETGRNGQGGIRQEVVSPTKEFWMQWHVGSPRRVNSNGKTNCKW